mmetsp:Transcript_13136/g.22200  ORF Transcript_13136/g.22200 Transcript_13136/m.22200 type:complete len:236 (-) Transcript_13136:217-924(-)
MMRVISGGRYQREPTWLERLRCFAFISFLRSSSFMAITCLISSAEKFLWSLFLLIDSRMRRELPLPEPMQLSGRVRERPKSQTLIWQSLLIRMLEGLMSLCSTLAECRYLNAHSRLYRISFTCSSVSLLDRPSFSNCLKSLCSCSITMKMFLRLVSSSSTGTMMSSNSGTKQQIPFLAVWCSPRMIWISRITLTQSYSYWEKFWMSLRATDRWETLHLPSTTSPKLPCPKCYTSS